MEDNTAPAARRDPRPTLPAWIAALAPERRAAAFDRWLTELRRDARLWDELRELERGAA